MLAKTRPHLLTASLAALAVVLAAVAPLSLALRRAGADDARVVYPETRRDDVTDDLHGTKVADPYRWLEDETSP